MLFSYIYSTFFYTKIRFLILSYIGDKNLKKVQGKTVDYGFSGKIV